MDDTITLVFLYEPVAVHDVGATDNVWVIVDAIFVIDAVAPRAPTRYEALVIFTWELLFHTSLRIVTFTAVKLLHTAV